MSDTRVNKGNWNVLLYENDQTNETAKWMKGVNIVARHQTYEWR